MVFRYAVRHTDNGVSAMVLRLRGRGGPRLSSSIAKVILRNWASSIHVIAIFRSSRHQG